MRVLFLIENYKRFYDGQLSDDPALGELPFAAQSAALFARSFYQADSYAHALDQRGHETWSVIPGCAPLQEAWAREAGLDIEAEWQRGREPWRPGRRKHPSPAERRDIILLAQLAAYRPDVLYVFSGVPVNADLLERARRHARALVLQWSCELVEGYPYGAYDLVLSSLPAVAERFRGMGLRTAPLPQAFDARVLSRVDTAAPRAGAVFAGSLSSAHPERLAFFETLAGRAPFAFYGWGEELLEETSPLRRSFRGVASGLDYYRVLAAARVAIHFPGRVGIEFAGAKRLVEATGAGATLLTFDQPGLDAAFAPSVEVVTFRDVDDCARKLHHLLAHDAEAAAIGAAGQRRTLRDHTFEALAPGLEARLNRVLSAEC